MKHLIGLVVCDDALALTKLFSCLYSQADNMAGNNGQIKSDAVNKSNSTSCQRPNDDPPEVMKMVVYN